MCSDVIALAALVAGLFAILCLLESLRQMRLSAEAINDLILQIKKIRELGKNA